MKTPPGSVDITELVEKIRLAWVDWGVHSAVTAATAIPGIGWFGLLLMKTIGESIVRAILDFISRKAEMLAFFVNTAIRKASQAKDFVSAVDAKYSLPKTATKEEFARAEQNQMSAFAQFVVVTG